MVEPGCLKSCGIRSPSFGTLSKDICPLVSDTDEAQSCFSGSVLDSPSSSESSADTKFLTQSQQGTKKKSNGCPRKKIRYRLCQNAHRAVSAVSVATNHHVIVDINAANTPIIKNRGMWIKRSQWYQGGDPHHPRSGPCMCLSMYQAHIPSDMGTKAHSLTWPYSPNRYVVSVAAILTGSSSAQKITNCLCSSNSTMTLIASRC